MARTNTGLSRATLFCGCLFLGAGVAFVPLTQVGRIPRDFFPRLHSSQTLPDAPASVSGPSDPPLSKTWERGAWLKGFRTAREEACYEVEADLERAGPIPADIEGTFYRNGPARFDVKGEQYMHPFDGDGMVNAVTFKDGKAVYRNRFVRTKGFKLEQRTGKIEYRGMFGTQKSGGMLGNMFDLKRKNVANTNVLYWGKKLVALWEGGLPHLLDPMTLQTIDESTLGRVLQRGEALTAHPRYDPVKKRQVFFSADVGPVKTKMTVREFDQDFKLAQERVEDMKGFSLLHDYVITDKYYVFTQAPLDVQPLPFVFGLKSIASCINFKESEPTTVYLIPRDLEQPMITMQVDTHFNFHFANAYDDPVTGEVVFDTVRVPKLFLTDNQGRDGKPVWEVVDYEREVPKSLLWRYRLDPVSGTHSKELLMDLYCDFPSVNPAVSSKPYKYTYVAAGRHSEYPTPVGTVMKLNVQTKEQDAWTCQPHEFIGEINFVAKKDGKEEDDGYLMTLLFDGQKDSSELLIFDAKSVAKGPVSRLPLRSNVPLTLHGHFAHDAVWDFDDIQRKYKVASALEGKSWNRVESGMAPIIEFME